MATIVGPNEAHVEDNLKGRKSIFQHFQDAGYVTAFVEDEQNWGTFQHWGEGFRSPPANHYTRVYMLEKASHVGHSPNCCFGESCNRVMFNKAKLIFVSLICN
jgi:hypothetical protein